MDKHHYLILIAGLGVMEVAVWAHYRAEANQQLIEWAASEENVFIV